MRLRAVAAAVLVATTVQVTSAAAAQTPPATDPPRQGCEQRSGRGQCFVEVPVPVGDSNPGGDSDDGGRQGGAHGPAPRPVCPWVTLPPGPETEANLRQLFPDAPPGAVLQVRDCADADPANPGGGQFGLGGRWLPGPGAVPAPPPPSAVALMLYTRVQARMEAPQLVTNPPAGAAAVVDLPVFVAVQNWQSEIVDRECVLLVCVELTASPSLEFAPGEPEADVVQCNPPGSRFDVAAGDPLVQASAPGACTHAYRLRTGVQDRPGEWPGQVTVRWTVSWTSNVGVSGAFPPLTFSSPAPRAVDEVQTVVADSS